MGIKEFQGGSGRISDHPHLLSLESGSGLLLLPEAIKGGGSGGAAAVHELNPEGARDHHHHHHHHHYPFAGVDSPKTGRLIREKLKGKKGHDDEQRRGPLVVRHPSAVQCPGNAPLSSSSKDSSVDILAVKTHPTTDAHVVRYGHRSLRTSRTPSPSTLRGEPLLSSSERVGLQRSQSNTGLNSPRRKRSPSTPRSRPESPSSIRGPSPAGSIDNLYIETVLKRVHIAMKARLYLLQQLGPHSFVVGGDSPEHKYKIMIGPQTCTCGRGPHCVHILFVMLRVFQISESDPLLWCKQLKNFEVESLFSLYEQQRSSRIGAFSSLKAKHFPANDESGVKQSTNEGMTTGKIDAPNSHSQTQSKSNDEGEKCVICLLEMVDCESLIDCSKGCHNKYHLHCISIWAEHCRRQEMQLFCPLCRVLWNGLPETNSSVPQIEFNSCIYQLNVVPQTSIDSSVMNCKIQSSDVIEPPVKSLSSLEPFHLSSIISEPTKTAQSGFRTFQLQQQNGNSAAASSSFQRGIGQSLRHQSHIVLPRCHSIVPKEFGRVSSLWAEAFGHDLVACLFSRDWKIKVIALRRLSQEVPHRLSSPSVGGNLSDCRIEDVVRVCCQIITTMASNPVYKVYLACLQCLKTLFAYVSIKTEENLGILQDFVKPLIMTILLRCCDGTKPGELSLATLVEICKGQAGDLAVGKETSFPSECGIGGVGFVLRCLFDGMNDKEPRSWQWLLGRLNVLEKLMQEFQQEFHLVLVRSGVNVSSEGQPLLPIASRYERLVTIWRFALAALCVQHTNVIKQAREIFMMGLRFAATVPAVLQQMLVLATTDPLLEQRVMAWVRDEHQDFLRNTWFATETGHFPPGQSFMQTHHRSRNEGSKHYLSEVRGPLKHPHLPSCGGISPTKGLDHSYLIGKLASVCANPVSPIPSPCQSATSSPSAARRKLPAWNASCNASSRVNSQQHQQQLNQLQGRLDSNLKNVVRGPSKRPNYLPLQGTFRDVLEWEKCNRTTSPTPSTMKHRSPPSRLGHQYKCDAGGDIGRAHCQQSNVFRRSMSTGGVAPLVNIHEKSPRTSRACPCDEVVMPTIKSRRRASDVMRPNLSRLCSRKLDGILGPILPSLPSQDKGPQMIRTQKKDFLPSTLCPLPLAMFDIKLQPPPPVPPCSPEGATVLLENNLCRLKQHAELEEAVALASAIENSVHQTEIPDIPGLMQCDSEQEFIIHNEPDMALTRVATNACKLHSLAAICKQCIICRYVMTDVELPDYMVVDDESSLFESYAYVENVHWQKGPILGTGAFSTCYQARDVHTGTLMAMKQVSFCRNSPDEQDKVLGSIKEEIALMARLNHPNIVRIMGATRQQNHFNMFVEWMPGGSVSNLLDKYGAFTESVIINYTQQVISGLAYLHDHQVLHRDLKGANLLVDSTGLHLRIGDFGAAARLASRTTIAGEFQGQLLGTIAFMAPEVLRGDDYGRSCDIWSVGCVLIEMATTKPPWNANDVSNHLALIYKIARAQDPPPVPERLSPATRDLALRCLEVKCDNRPPAKELLRHPVFKLNWLSS